jgi:hypothetical protein
MLSSTLRDRFASMDARIMVEPVREMWESPRAARLFISRDHRGEYFHLMVDPRRFVAVEAPEFGASQTRMLLEVRQRKFGSMALAPTQRYLVGRDQETLFAIELPDRSARRPRSRPYQVAALDPATRAHQRHRKMTDAVK